MDDRIRPANDKLINPEGDFVLYWMNAARRTEWNYGLDRAATWSHELGLPLLVFEGLRTGYRWETDRTNQFIIDGMRANARACAEAGVTYYPYIGEGKGLLAALSQKAAVIVTDDAPVFFLPQAVAAAAKQVRCQMEVVDSVGIIPFRSIPKAYERAYLFRKKIEPLLEGYIKEAPSRAPLERVVAKSVSIDACVRERWPAANLCGKAGAGGSGEARRVLDNFLVWGLDSYHETGNDLDDRATSGLSPYLHFGHISAHEIVDVVNRHAGDRLHLGATAFLDQLITWRELGHNTAHLVPNYEKFETLPKWALRTLDDHSEDRRPHLYSREAMENAETYDELWNATQNQLRREGTIYSYVRMLWAKKVIEWSQSAEEAWDTLIDFNNKYALDGRDPNSYCGIAWSFGRYDRPWPERAIFGKVRYMSSQNTARKLKVREYVERYAKP